MHPDAAATFLTPEWAALTIASGFGCAIVLVLAGVLVRTWPLSWRRTTRRLRAAIAKSRQAAGRLRRWEQVAARNRRRAEAADLRAEEFARRMELMQSRFARWLRECCEPWNREAERALRLVSGDRRSILFAAMTDPEAVFELPPRSPAIRTEFTQREVPLIRLGLSVGLSDDCPPELVADRIAEQVRGAILRQWQRQSALLTR